MQRTLDTQTAVSVVEIAADLPPSSTPYTFMLRTRDCGGRTSSTAFVNITVVDQTVAELSIESGCPSQACGVRLHLLEDFLPGTDYSNVSYHWSYKRADSDHPSVAVMWTG